MVVTCTHCRGKMRVDESSISKGDRVKVRCPHCEGTGFVDYGSDVFHPDQAPPPRPQTEIKPVEDVPKKETIVENQTRPKPAEPPKSPAKADPAFPPDAFKDFRFPAEREPQNRQPAKKPKMKLIWWILISLAIVLIFAGLVNIILPGPGGTPQLKHKEVPAAGTNP